MTERLYNLLPAVYRRHDADQGQPLRALCLVLEAELDRVHADIDQLYDDAFAETVSGDRAAYLGELLGLLPLAGTPSGPAARAYVAHGVAVRRRNGTPTALEQVARDVLVAPAKVVEALDVLVATQSMHPGVRRRVGTAPLTDASRLEWVGGPFEEVAHTVDVRSVGRGEGRYNRHNVSVHPFMTQVFELDRLRATPATPGSSATRFFVHPFQVDTPLYNRPASEDALSTRARAIHAPVPLTRRMLRDAVDSGLEAEHLLGAQPALRIEVDGAELGWDQILVCALDDVAGTWGNSLTGYQAAVDPERGRIRTASAASAVHVTATFASGGPIGGGGYARTRSILDQLPRGIDRHVGVAESGADGKTVFSDIGAAWSEAVTAGANVLITVLDNGAYELPAGLVVPAGTTVVLASARWPTRQVGVIDARGLRPTLKVQSGTTFSGTGTSSQQAGKVVLSGFALVGSVVVGGVLGHLVMMDLCQYSSLGTPPVSALAGSTPDLDVTVERSTVLGLALAEPKRALRLRDSVVLGGVSAAGTWVQAERTTILGDVTAERFTAGDCIVDGQLSVDDPQGSCLAHSYLPRLPDRVRAHRSVEATTGRPRLAARSVLMGTQLQPHAGRLSPRCPAAIREGASDGGEMGAFNTARIALRLKNLRGVLDEHVRLGTHAGLFEEI